jgi:Ankyrin repeats (3 copies)
MSREVSNYKSITLPAETPAPAPQPQQPQALVYGASTIGSVQAHDEKPVKSSFYEELTARLAKGEKPSDAMLDEAIEHGSKSSIKLLVRKMGVDLDRQVGPDGNTRLHNACKAGDSKAVKLLLACGADVHVDNDHYMPPSVMAFDLPPKNRDAVLREFANHYEGAVQIASWARHLDRNDILNWVETNNFIGNSLV